MPPKTLRLFIAIELPAALRQALAALQEDLKRQAPPRSVRWVAPDSIHLTLKFLGETPEDRVAAIIQGMAAAAAGFAPFQFQVAGFGCFPNLRRPNVLWVGVPQVPKALAGLQLATDLQMVKIGYDREKRAFSPHLTLGRVNRNISGKERQTLGEVIARTTDVGNLGIVDAKEIILFQSDLKATGAVYTALTRTSLDKGQIEPE